MSDNRSHFGALLLVCLVLLGACVGNGTGGAASDQPLVVVTTSILGDVVSTLVGEDATVEVLMPPGVDPHDFEPSARQAASLRDADAVVVNGLGLEAGLASTLDGARADGATVVAVGDLIEPLPFHPAGSVENEHDRANDHDHDDAHQHDHDHGEFDPHFWHDPTVIASAIGPLVEAISDAVPDLDRSALEGRAAELIEDLNALDTEIEAILAPIPADRRVLLTNHHTLGYFAQRYGFEIIGTIIPGGDTMSSPSASELAALVAVVEQHQAPAIFIETIASRTLADTLAAELGSPIEVVELYSDALGPEGSDGETYPAMLRANAIRIADALR